jgi:hypothetical protein
MVLMESFFDTIITINHQEEVTKQEEAEDSTDEEEVPRSKKYIDCCEEGRNHIIRSAIINGRPRSCNKEEGNKMNGTRKEGHIKENTIWS